VVSPIGCVDRALVGAFLHFGVWLLLIQSCAL
jgi:hypothetical protein